MPTDFTLRLDFGALGTRMAEVELGFDMRARPFLARVVLSSNGRKLDVTPFIDEAEARGILHDLSEAIAQGV